MADVATSINPYVDLTVFPSRITPANVGHFLDGAEVVVDGIDFFEIEARRLLHQEARRRGLWVVGAGPLGFSTAWIAFSPTGMTFDEYFDLREGMSRSQKLVAYAVGMAPRATHLSYFDTSQVDFESGAAPSAGLACQLASGVVACEVLRLLTGRRPPLAAPWSFQFDAYRGVLRRCHLRRGNRALVQRLKRWVLARRLGV
jgi:molybdopterin/thiamine biosynthesis adenylyltransferase